MSLRHALRSKFRPNANERNDQGASMQESSEYGDEGQVSVGDTDTLTDEWHNFDDRGVFEMQLSNLQEQLVATMISNQKLTKELEQLKEEKHVDQLYKQLEEQKMKNDELNARVLELEETSMNERLSDEADGPRRENLINTEETGSLESTPNSSRGNRLYRWMEDKILTFLQDFSDDSDLEEVTPTIEQELSVRKLKENLRRFKLGAGPPMLYLKVLSALMSWQSPASTFIAFMLYMYAIYSGWFLTVLFGLILWHFSKTYLISRGWNIEFSLLPYHTIEEDTEEEKSLGMPDKFHLVLQVAKKAQNLLGDVADGLEKLQNLISWSDVQVTKSLYKNVCAGFILSLFVSASTLLTYAGVFIGVKLFITKNLYRKYPRLKQKYDTTAEMWKKLPTNEQKVQRKIVSQRRQYLVNIDDVRTSSHSFASTSSASNDDACKTFADAFKLENDEVPLQGWEDGKRTTLIQKGKALGAAFRSGKLYLTKSYLCFRRSRLFTPKNLTISLCDITKLEKINPFNFIPGSGMSIEVHVSSVDKPFIFGAILNRDEVFAELLQVAKSAQLAWSRDAGSEEELMPNEDQVDAIQ